MRIERLARHHRLDEFDCGVPALNDWLRRYAGQSQRENMAVTYVAHDDDVVVAYYAVVASEVVTEEAPRDLARRAGRPKIPVILLARLAVDSRQQGRGLGAGLLRDALLRAASAADLVGTRAVVVDAKDDAVAFYAHFDFLPFPDQPSRLYLPIRVIRDVLGLG